MSLGRFLRSSTLRAALFLNARGRCQGCGVALKKGWHADHKVPWHLVRKTNLFNMQALCPACNLAKGGRGVDVDALKRFNAGALRPGQQGAVEKILERVVAGKTNTSIVLPTRYGKTDVMRVAGTMLIHNGIIGRCLILEPAANLVGQVKDPAGMEAAVERYGLPWAPSVMELSGQFRFEDLVTDRADFTAMTIQMATLHRDVLAQLAEWEGNDPKKGPILVFIDEAHTGSNLNRWGECAETLARAGAFLVLLTATPFRSDKAEIYGFKYDPFAVETIRIHRPNRESEMVDLHEGSKTISKLRADYEYSFQNAWREIPLPICHINYRSFDVNLEEVTEDTNEHLGRAWLSELGKVESRRALGGLVRTDAFINAGVERFVYELEDFRKKVDTQGQGRIKGIVYVGSDRDDDEIDNEHAVRVTETIKRYAEGLRVDIATTSMGKGAEEAQGKIAAFQDGSGADVLIVKQMGGIGLDVPSLKVCLDLSPVRTGPQFIQRMMRIGTVWKLSDDGSKDAYIATYVVPDDILAYALFDQMVRGHGGEATMTNTEYQETYRREERDGEKREEVASRFIAGEGRDGKVIRDTLNLQTDSTNRSLIERITSKMPILKNYLTDPQVGSIKDIVEEAVKDEGEGSSPAPDMNVKRAPVRDIGAKKKELRDEINRNVRELVYKENPDVPQSVYGDLVADYMTTLKVKRAGLPYKQLGSYSLEELEHLKEESALWLNGRK